MDQTGKDLLNLMFDPGESICVSKTQYASHSISLNSAMDGTVTLLSEDPSLPTRYCDSSELLLVAINPCDGFRKDASVTKFRSFLWEIDVGSIKEQLGTFRHFGIPLSGQIFSGNKSVHAITVLSEPIPDLKTYRYLYQWALNIMTVCDQNCKNPSRSIRIPGAYREPGKKQRLISIGQRIPLSEFMAWLNRYPHLRPVVRSKKERLTGDGDFSRLSSWAQNQLKHGLKITKGRNQFWFGLFCDFALAGYTKEEAISILGSRFIEEFDFKEKEWLIIAQSAFKNR
jgi:hypothetical protein